MDGFGRGIGIKRGGTTPMLCTFCFGCCAVLLVFVLPFVVLLRFLF